MTHTARALLPALLPALCAALLAACESAPSYDYTALLERSPRSILVLPPLDETIETGATYGALSSVTRPLVERGFYVFPVGVVDAMMRDNGLPTPFEMHQVPLEKLREIFDPDAVLYMKVTSWGTSYQVINSATTVALEGVLVDAETGLELWSGSRAAAQNSGDGGGGLVGSLAGALLNQVTTSISDPSRDLSRAAAVGLFTSSGSGLLPGPYHPEQETLLAETREDMSKTAESD